MKAMILMNMMANEGATVYPGYISQRTPEITRNIPPLAYCFIRMCPRPNMLKNPGTRASRSAIMAFFLTSSGSPLTRGVPHFGQTFSLPVSGSPHLWQVIAVDSPPPSSRVRALSFMAPHA